MVWICPPLIITRQELEYGLDIMEEALELIDQALDPAAVLAEVSYGSY
jgi:taurine--2-oxoglutarate transaminase